MTSQLLCALLLVLLATPMPAITADRDRAAASGDAASLRNLLENHQTLNFDVSLAGEFVAGELTLATADRTRINGVNAYHVTARLRSVGIVSALHRKVDESYDSYVDPDSLRPIRFIATPGNGRSETVTIDQKAGIATTGGGTKIRVPAETYDPASLLFVLRTVDPRPGHKRIFHMLRGTRLYTVSVEPDGKEKIYTRVADYEAYRFAVKLVDSSKENDSYKIRLYLTRDARRLPVLITAELPGGNSDNQIRVELTRHSG